MFRKTVTRPLPEGAKLLGGGKAKIPGGKSVRVNSSGRMILKTETWYTRHGGKVVPLCSDRAEATAMEAALRLDGARVARGLPTELRFDGDRPLAELVAVWVSELESAGRDPGHTSKFNARAMATLRSSGLVTISDISAPAAAVRVAGFLAALKSPRAAVRIPEEEEFTPAQVRVLLACSPTAVSKLAAARGVQGTGKGKARRFSRAGVETLVRHRGRGSSPATVNGYLAAFRSFANWLKKKNLAPAIPSLPVRLDESRDRRIVRRALSLGEVRRLAEATRAEGKDRAGLSAEARATLYEFAFWSLLRRRALEELTQADCHLDEKEPWVQVRGETDKTGRSRAIPVPPDVAAKVSRLVKREGLKNGPIWPISDSIVQSLRSDLKAAGIEFRNGEGVVDFHAFRHSGATHLARSGVGLDIVAKVGGWSNLQMFFERYGHYSIGDLAGSCRRAWS